MSDLLLFFIGCLVSLVVLSAVGLLLWGAANEPGSSFASKDTQAKGPRSLQRTPERTAPCQAERAAG